MPPQPEQTLLHYRLTAKIGEGGMGEVWQATDTTLDRQVAIKVLPESFARDPERLARFEREAKLLASLNHPNIAAIFSVHADKGQHFLAMELVEGEDLSTRLQRGPLPVDEALTFAGQIADALESAHEKGVIHRDLKPANLRITADDKLKVLDFGLAKAFGAADSEHGNTDPTLSPSMSPTMTSAGTQAGMILGTAAYMSPEQAKGKPVDTRADIWAFSAVLYEMLTGRPTFKGDTVSELLASVLRDTPDLDALPQELPRNIHRLIGRCLRKDPRQRLRDIGDARIELQEAIEVGDSSADAFTTPAAAVAGSRKANPWLIATLATLGAVVLFTAGWKLRPSEELPAGLPIDQSIRRLTFDEGLEFEPSLSPNGHEVAYTTDRMGNLDIEILPLDGGDVQRVVTHPADDAQPRWSPDGTRLAFVSARDRPGGLVFPVGGLGVYSTYVTGEGGDIFLVPARGGNVTKLIDDGFYPTWSPDGKALAFQSSRDGRWRIWRVPVTGGDPVLLSDHEDGVIDFQPAWSPDGRWVTYGSLGEDGEYGLYSIPAKGGERTLLHAGPALAPFWSHDGRSVYFSSDRTAAPGVMNLWRLRVGNDGRPIGDTQRVERVTFGDGSDIDTSMSVDGRRLTFANVKFAPDIWSLDPVSRELKQVTASDGGEDNPHLNPDGRRLLFLSDRSGSNQLWSLDLEDGDLRLLVTQGSAQQARWSPDGSHFAYGMVRDGVGGRVAVQRWGDVTAEVLEGGPDRNSTGVQWSRDGRRIATSGDGIWVHTLGAEFRQLVDDGLFPTWSPDGKQIAYQHEVGGDRREIWVVPSEGGEPQVLAGGEVHYSHPQWCPTDADRIVVVIDHQDLGLLHVGSGEVERLTDLASSTMLVDYPSWSADGRTVYFSLSRKRGDVFLIEESNQ